MKAKFKFRLSGRKVPNKLSESVLQQAELLAKTGAIMKDYSDSTIEDIFKDLKGYAQNMKTERVKNIRLEWLGHGEERTMFGIWENNDAVWRTASALAYISIVQED